MGSGCRRSIGNVRSFMENSIGDLSGSSSLASWIVAGTLAYYLWVRPSQQLKREQQEKAALTAASDQYRYVEK
ncbi:hypothetical protein BUALT_Bualt14G0005300 [Buddleja alternifolia]|uniref:Uncharacterized protein n=1 Tax=Buddleja alternifolia TaxID=168488 RepID=A0AAV6WFS8_9LAMI|nr:hypothetical protein BUALT_Bualt14G0005300 [Buddleja alternifolia]